MRDLNLLLSTVFRLIRCRVGNFALISRTWRTLLRDGKLSRDVLPPLLSMSIKISLLAENKKSPGGAGNTFIQVENAREIRISFQLLEKKDC